MNPTKRILTIQDISCVGQCSLTAALPVISACGVECSVLPTAVLSTHTGADFSGWTFRDLTDDISPITAHWKRQGLTFSAISTGYLGSARQIQLVAQLIDTLRQPDTLVCVDPAMADNGKFYSGFDAAYGRQMAALCAKADLILPNLTEACFLLGEETVPERYDLEFCLARMRQLHQLDAKTVLLTGAELEPGVLTNLIYNGAAGTLEQVSRRRKGGAYHGTGDLFASACIGRLMRGDSLEQAVERASDFIIAAIGNTAEEHTYGVSFEGCLGMLTD